MAKLLFVLVTLFIATNAESRECNSGDIKGKKFIYSDGKKNKSN